MKKKVIKAIGIGILTCTTLLVVAATFTFSVTENPKINNDNIYREHVAEHYKIYSLATPNGLDFAGEKVPLEDLDIRERLDKELTINTYWHSSSIFMMKRANRWFSVIVPILKEEGIPEDFKYLAAVESNFDHVVSPAGASGYWQFLKSTGQSYGLEINSYIDERYNVEKATRAACKYFKDAYAVLKSWTLVAASYNMGIGGVQGKLKDQDVSNYYDLYLNSETHRYVFRILAIKEISKNPEFYGFNIRPQDLYPAYETTEVEIDSSINNLTSFARTQHTDLKILKLLNPWLRSSSLPNKSGKKYTIKLPKEGSDLHVIEP